MTTSPVPVRQLRRSTDDKEVGGVCAGVARYFGVDPALVRIVWLIAALFGGTGLFVYLVAWVVIPADDGPTEPHEYRPIGVDLGSADQRKVFGIVLITMAVLFASDGLLLGSDILFPLALIAGGAWLVFRTSDEDAAPPSLWTPHTTPDSRTAPRDGTASPADGVPADVVDPPTFDASTGSADQLAAAGSMTSDDEVDRLLEAARAYEWGDHLVGDDLSPTPAERRPSSRGPRLTMAALGLAVAAMGLLIVVDRAGVLHIGVESMLAIALALVGALLVGGSFLGQVRGLIPVGVLLTLAVLATTATDVPFDGGFGSRVVRVAAPTDLEPSYRMLAGELTLDLRPLDGLSEGTIDVSASVAMGSLVVLVDDDVRVRGTASVDLGDLAVPEDVDTGGSYDGVRLESTFDVGQSAGTIVLDLDVGLGEIEVRRS